MSQYQIPKQEIQQHEVDRHFDSSSYCSREVARVIGEVAATSEDVMAILVTLRSGKRKSVRAYEMAQPILGRLGLETPVSFGKRA